MRRNLIFFLLFGIIPAVFFALGIQDTSIAAPGGTGDTVSTAVKAIPAAEFGGNGSVRDIPEGPYPRSRLEDQLQALAGVTGLNRHQREIFLSLNYPERERFLALKHEERQTFFRLEPRVRSAYLMMRPGDRDAFVSLAPREMESVALLSPLERDRFFSPNAGEKRFFFSLRASERHDFLSMGPTERSRFYSSRERGSRDADVGPSGARR
jgi:hypothetical protein